MIRLAEIYSSTDSRDLVFW